MAIYAFGDIQGCYTALRQLLARVPWRPETDRLWFVGDLVNRGSESLAVLRYVKQLGDRSVVVLGNHDLYLLAVAEGILPLRPRDTFKDVLTAPDRDELLHWLRHRPLLHQEQQHVLVHAGLLPQWQVTEAAALAREVEEALRGPAYRSVLHSLFTQERRLWSESLTGSVRLKTITDALTRLRICTPAGEIHHTFKGEVKDIPPGFRPWFEIEQREQDKETLVCGHWSALGLHLTPRFLGLDSGCIWGRALTALRLEDRAVFQVRCDADGMPVDTSS
ncbi:MAG: symmetrical bis(5'-nucleosyl)-tetraphosphatase [Nitrospiraceae bacterium]